MGLISWSSLNLWKHSSRGQSDIGRRRTNDQCWGKTLGRVFDAIGEPLDRRPMPPGNDVWPLHGKLVNPLERNHISEFLDVGVRSINSLLTIAKGQRVGIIAGSGVGKSVLLSMMTKYSAADVIVVGLIGERSREVLEFVDKVFDPETKKKLCAVAVPADRSPCCAFAGQIVQLQLQNISVSRAKTSC